MGVLAGYCVPGEKYAKDEKIYLTVVSELHSDDEYGIKVDSKGKHFGGPFQLEVALLSEPPYLVISLRHHG